MGMVAIVLLIATTNVANLLLVRSAARAKEVAIRLCVGGGRSRLIRQFLTESVLLALCGGVLGTVIAIWGTAGIMRIFNSVETKLLIDISPNPRIFAFTMAVSVVTGIAFGLVPAWRSTRLDLTPALKDGAIPPSGRRWSMSHLLVGTQLALSIVALAIAALLVRSLVNLRTLDAGFEGGNLLLVTVDTAGTPVTPEARLPIYLALLDRLRAAPGVTSVSGSKSTPIHTSGDARALVMPSDVPDTIEARAVFTNPITPEYFDTLGIRLRRGRLLTDLDTATSPRVAVINETMAKFIGGDRDAIGMTFAFKGEPNNSIEIVGVVQDTHQMNLRDAPIRTAYTPMTQVPSAPSYFQIEIRTAHEPVAFIGSLPPLVRSVSRDLVIRYVRTMDQQINASLVRSGCSRRCPRASRYSPRPVRDRPVRGDVLHGHAPVARDRDPHGTGSGAQPRARPGTVANLCDRRRRNDRRHHRRAHDHEDVEHLPVRIVGTRSGDDCRRGAGAARHFDGGGAAAGAACRHPGPDAGDQDGIE